jgi:hypothetical protein
MLSGDKKQIGEEMCRLFPFAQNDKEKDTISAMTKFCIPTSLWPLIKQQSMIYFLRYNWD